MQRALIISQKSFTRRQLRQLVLHCEEFSHVNAVSSLSDARTAVHDEDPYNVLFIGSEFEPKEVAEFIQERKIKQNSRAPYSFIVVFEGQDNSHNAVAEYMMMGFHGFLCQPFTIESVSEISSLADRVSQKKTIVRLKAATGLLLSDLKDEEDVDEDGSKKDLWEEVQESCAWYNNVTAESLTQAIKKRLHGVALEDRINNFKSMRSRAAKLRKRMGRYISSNLPFFRESQSKVKR